MAYRVDAGSNARALGLSADSNDLAVRLRLDSDAVVQHKSAFGTPTAHAIPNFAFHTASPFDHSALQVDHGVAAHHAAGHAPASNVDSSLLAQLDALLPGAPDGFVMRCMCPACMKAAIQTLSADDDGHSTASGGHHSPTADGPVTYTPGIGGDDVPDDNSSTVGFNVQEGQIIESAIDHPLDEDWFVAQLSASETYHFTMTPSDQSGAGPDFKIVIHAADGSVITEQDSNGMGVAEDLIFTPDTDGTYYISVAPFTPGDIGGYTLAGRLDSPDINAGTPLDAIDWGGTERRVDTDGVESANGDDVIHFYFAQTGEVYQSDLQPVVVAQDWQPFEKQAAYTAFQQYDHIINTDYVEVFSAADADFVLVSDAFEPNILGRMSPPGEQYEGQAEFNNLGIGWTEDGLKQGGFGFITLIHELGHGHGLAHPHDTGGGSTVMNGVVEEPPPSALDYTTGDFGLNNGVYTTMSYNDGWDKDGPNGPAPTNDYGYQGTLMAFDVAVLQQKYGANMNYHTGNNVYVLPDVNAAGTFYSCIWDAAGVDTIASHSAHNTVIDLRAATLQYEEGGGGWVSWAEGIWGGFTIANGVVIEKAIGGGGNDAITGNDANNALSGRGGADTILGGKGADIIRGGGGTDTITGGRGQDHLRGGHGGDTFVFGDFSTRNVHADSIADLHQGDLIDLSAIDADTGTTGDQGFALVDHFHGVAGEMFLKLFKGANVTKLSMDTDGDHHADMVILLHGHHVTFENFVL